MNQLLRWDADIHRLRPAADDTAPATIVDSWHALNGRVRGLDRHRARFAAACATAAGHIPAEDSLWRAVRAAMPPVGSWFPRIELVESGAQPFIQLRIRPAPPLADSAVVWVPHLPDPRTHPQLKGPDLPVLLGLREQAGQYGASEAILCDEQGTVIEGATSNVLWWDGDTLCLPDRALPALRGVTEQLIISEAERRGVPLSYRRYTVAELRNCEVWLTNALHGIRPVVGWRPADHEFAATEPVVSQRARQWQQWLAAQCT